MSMVESVQPTMEEESFIILGSTPTPSMVNFSMPPASFQPTSVVEREVEEPAKVSSAATKMEISTQLDSTTYSLLPNGGSLSASVAQLLPGMQSLSESSKALLIASAESIPPQQPPSGASGEAGAPSLQSIENKENVPLNSIKSNRQPTASFIIGETQSILHQFPSLAQSTMSIEEIHLLQKLSMEHSQLKESLQRANVAMRKNFTSIQQLQDETRTRCAEQEARISEQQRQIEKLMAENTMLLKANDTLADELNVAKAATTRAEAELETVRKELSAEVEEVGRVREVERKAAQLEVDEVRKESSERQSIIQNLAKKIEDLELQIKGFVVVKSNKPEKSDTDASFVPLDVHKQQIKALERRMSVEVAKNLEFEDMRKLFVDEINCLKANANTAEQVFAQSRFETQQLYDTIKERDNTIEDLRKQVCVLREQSDVLAAQSEIFQKDFEAERAGRQELASEKSRILAEFEVLQRRNTELEAKVSMTESEREQVAQRAAQMVQVATNSQEAASSNQAATSEQNEPRSLLRCPLCLKGYKELSALQSHAAFCMGNE
ncbi:NF-kappa-B essential modulator [Anopheles ziemanni]|uniref:NF-kappa-B essential modulator n=1 Tax=Anopheles coustani TaxID=139045 RepID=UPI00265859DB|nr:NF-kappa-B essential modulator [Anopheles coustani]XP_058171621.1 NF-kappa-B essential modulator [Anopheles ziemanni]